MNKEKAKIKNKDDLRIKRSIDNRLCRVSNKISDAVADGSIKVSDIQELIDKHLSKFYVGYKESYIKLLQLEELIDKLHSLDDKERTEAGLTNAKPIYMKEFKRCSCCLESINIAELAIEAEADNSFRKRFNSIKRELNKKDSKDAYEHKEEIERIAYMRAKEQSKYVKIWLCEKCSYKIIEDASKISKR